MNHEISLKIAEAVREHLSDCRAPSLSRETLADVIEYAWLYAQEQEDAANARKNDLLETMVSITTMGAKP